MGARCWLLLAAVFFWIAAADAAELRIRYAETVRLEPATAPGGASKAGAGPSLVFTAYGRAFQTELQANSRVLRSLSPQKQRQLGATPYKGTLAGIAGSWVRLTRTGEHYSGAIWDGAELYLVAPAQAVSGSIESPLAADPNGTVIFRVDDTEGGLLGGTCAASSLDSAEASGSERYRALLNELKGRLPMQAAAIAGEIEVSVLGDSQFGARFGASSADVMVSRMNVVDGIFAEDLGIFIIPTDLTTFGGGDDPFTGTDSINLLAQVGNYRNQRPALSARAITHLMTGRDLNGSTIGIGYMSGICDARFGASLSESGGNDPTASLIIAHELGHNFGAPHDDEAGSPCASTPNGWLMNPYINGSNRFSACSVQQMQPVISTAACVLPARVADVAVSVDTADMRAPINSPYSFPVTVASVGDQPAEQVNLSINGVSFGVESVAAPAGATCTSFGSVECSLGTLSAGQSVQIVVNMRASQFPGTLSGAAVVRARVDRNSANNIQPLSFTTFAGSDVTVAMAVTPGRVVVDDPFELTVDVNAAGAEAAANVVATVSLGNAFQIDSAVPPSGSCTIRFGYEVSCPLGSIPSGERRRIVLQAHARRGAGLFSLFAGVQADNDAASPNNGTRTNIMVDSRQDVAIVQQTSVPNQIIDVPFDYAVDVWSRGVEAATNVTFNLSLDSALVLQQATAASGTCQVTGQHVSCALGTLAPGISRRVTLRLLAPQTGNYLLNPSVGAARNDDISNDSASTVFMVRHTVDVGLQGSTGILAVEGEGRLFASLYSAGAMPATNVQVRAVLPAGFPVSGATVDNGTCTVTATTAECVVASIGVTGVTLIVTYTSSAPGSFTAEFSASVAGDGNAANNQLSTLVTVQPYTDVRISSGPERINAAPGDTFDVPLVIAADRRAVSDVGLHVGSFYNMTVQSVSAPDGGACTSPSSAAGVTCTFGDLAENATRRVVVTVRVNADLGYSFSSAISAYVSAPLDRNSANNAYYVPVDVVLRGDAAISVAQSSVSVTRGQSFTLPAITVTGVRTVENVSVQVTLPSWLTFMHTAEAQCQVQTPILHCSLSTITAGTNRNLSLTVQATSAGSATLDVRLVAPGDEDAQNNASSIAVTANEPVAPNNPGGGGGGGGGGGAMAWQALLGLLLLQVARRRSRAA